MRPWAIVAAAAMLAAVAMPTAARENRPLSCSIGAARHAPPAAGPAMVAQVPRAMTPIDLNAVQMDDRGVWKSVIVQQLLARRTEMNTLEVMARLVNCTKEPIVVQARSNFLDAQQAGTEPASAWKPVHISPLSFATYQERSIGTSGVGAYLIELRSDQ